VRALATEKIQGLADSRAQGPVRRRRVLYVHGFDPRGPAPYHRMFVEQAALQAPVSGAALAAGPRRRGREADVWDVEAGFEDGSVSTTWEFLRWDQVVRRLWIKPGPRMLAETLRATAVVWRSGLLRRAQRFARPLAIVLVLPVVVLGALLALGFAAAAGLAAAAYVLATAFGAPEPAPWLAALAAAPIGFVLARLLWRRIDEAFRISWLVQSIVHITWAARGKRPEIDETADRIGRRIVEAASEEDLDELLIVGHSYGAAVAVMALARALELDPMLGAAPRLPTVSLLTLGQAIAAWDHVAEGARFHDDLTAVVKAEAIPWVDVTSPSDGITSSWLNPVELVEGDGSRPVRRSPHFHLILSRERFRHIRMRPFDFHFQYLCAAESPGGFDVFRMTCGPERLPDFGRAWTRFVDDRP
jgi:hypothetical protein